MIAFFVRKYKVGSIKEKAILIFYGCMWLSLVILAAGFGSRYGWLKQIDWFWPHQEPIILYSIFDALRAWFDHVVFVIREEFAEAFKETIWRVVEKTIRVSYVFQEKDAYVPTNHLDLVASREKPRWTAHATLIAKTCVNQPFAVINADDFYGRDAFVQIATFLRHCTPRDIGMVGYILRNTLSPFWSINRWVCTTNGDMLETVEEHLKIQEQADGILYDEHGIAIDHDAIVSMNFRWFHPSFFAHSEAGFVRFLDAYTGKGEYYIPTVVDYLLAHQQATCRVLMSHDQRCGVSYQEDRPFVESTIARLHEQGVYPESLFPEEST